MNANLPPIQVWVRNEFLYWDKKKGYTYAHLISCRALQNQAIQISVLTDDGALFTGLPVNAIAFNKKSEIKPLQEVLMWDNIGSEIQVICFDTLRYMNCVVKTSSKKLIEAEYLFTIDYIGNNDLSRSSEHWKQTHALMGKDGNLYIYPQYRIQFKDKGLCFNSNKILGNYKYNRETWKVGS